MPKSFSVTLFIAIGIVVFAVLPALAESVDTAWVRRYNGPGNDWDAASAIAVDDSGNVYVTGESDGAGTASDYATIKYYADGDTAWVRRYNGPGNDVDVAYAIAVDDSGNVYITGLSYGNGTSYDYATIKYDQNGNTVWVRRYNGPGNYVDAASDVAVDDSGNVYVTGERFSGYETAGDYATIKYYANGDTAWVRTYNGPANDYDKAYAIAIDGFRNVSVTGYSVGSGGNWDYATIKYYANGDTAWVRTYNGPGNDVDVAYAIAVDDSGNVYVTGESDGAGTYRDYTTIKYDPDGDEVWVKRYEGPGVGSDWASAIAVDDFGSVYVTGGSYGHGSTTAYDYATIKYYQNGDTAWIRRYSGMGNNWDVAHAIAIDNCGNAYVTGYSWKALSYDYATIKYDSSANQLWVQTYNGPGNNNDEAYAITVDALGNIYVSGRSRGSGTAYDYATIKYVQTGTDVRDETESREKPSEFTLSQNYPNPFNQSTKIEFTLAHSGFASLNIYDILGRKVRTLISEHLSSGYKSVLWDGKNDSGKDVASGIYFYQLRAGDFSETKKLVLLK